jgi:hypothetical protein
MADVNVTFAGDTSALDRAIDEVKTRTQNLVPGGAGSGILTPLPAALGGPAADTLLSRATAAAKANAAAKGELTGATNKARDAEDEFGEAAKRSGINMGAMMERMATRLVVFEALRLAIKGVIDIFKEVTGLETARVHFENLSAGADKLAAVESSLIATTKATNIEFGKLSTAVLSLEDAGEGPLAAAAEVDLLAKRAAATGEDVDVLAKALERVEMHESTAQDMFTLAHAAGTAKDELLSEVTAFERLTRELKEAERAHDALISRMEIAEREFEKEAQMAERTADRQAAAAERTLEATERAEDRKIALYNREMEAADRVAERQLSMAEKLAEAQSKASGGRISPEQAFSNVVRRSPELLAEYKRGVQLMAEEEGVNADALVRKRIIGVRDVIAAGKAGYAEDRRQVDEQRQAQKQAEEDRKRGIEEQRRASKQAQEDITGGFKQMNQATKDLYAGQKEQDALVLARQKLKIENDLVQAIGDQKDIQDGLAKAMGTVSEKFASIATSLKAMVDESPEFLRAFERVANFATMITNTMKGLKGPEGMGGPTDPNLLTTSDPGKVFGGFLQKMFTLGSNISGVSGQALANVWKNLFPQSVIDDNKRTANATEKIAGVFATE